MQEVCQTATCGIIKGSAVAHLTGRACSSCGAQRQHFFLLGKPLEPKSHTRENYWASLPCTQCLREGHTRTSRLLLWPHTWIVSGALSPLFSAPTGLRHLFFLPRCHEMHHKLGSELVVSLVKPQPRDCSQCDDNYRHRVLSFSLGRWKNILSRIFLDMVILKLP